MGHKVALQVPKISYLYSCNRYGLYGTNINVLPLHSKYLKMYQIFHDKYDDKRKFSFECFEDWFCDNVYILTNTKIYMVFKDFYLSSSSNVGIQL